jgi:acyl-CoA thioesterase
MSALPQPAADDALTGQALAEAVREHMLGRDRAAQGLGIRFLAVGPGAATLQMTVRADMLNGFDICHGGVVATLADTAFAYACNAYNEMTVASGFSVDLLAAARAGDVLTASAAEVSLAGRTGVYDVAVSNQRGERVAVFRGRSYRIKGKPVIEPPAGNGSAAPTSP